MCISDWSSDVCSSDLSSGTCDIRLGSTGMEAAQMPVLAVLQTGESLSQSELSRRAMVPLPILAQVLTHMKNSGLIQYEHDPHDGESKLILLTKLAYDCMPAVRKAFQQSDEDMIQGFASSEVEALVAMLRRVLDNVERVAK